MTMSMITKGRHRHFLLKCGKGFGTARLGYIFEVNRRFGDDHLPVVDFVRSHWNQFIAEMQEWQRLSVEIKAAVLA
jgi:hypothetical protein